MLAKILEDLLKKKKRKCKHIWVNEFVSNALQTDHMGYTTRLYSCRCIKCNKREYQWLGVPDYELEEVGDGKSVFVKWERMK